MPVERAAAAGLAATWNVSVPWPWPDAVEANDSHDASLDAVQEHSRSVATDAVPLPPAAGKDLAETPTVTWHLLVDAPTRLVDAEELQPTRRTVPSRAGSTRPIRSK